MKAKGKETDVGAGHKCRPNQTERSKRNVLSWLLPFALGGLLASGIAVVA